MQRLVSPLTPFSNIYWWWLAGQYNIVTFDHHEHFIKMTYRNRYYITGANGLIQLSIPLQKGRDQRTPMKDVMIDNKERWQMQHWRTIYSVYGRAPYFEHYAPELEQLFKTEYTHLQDFNMATLLWVKQQLRLPVIFEASTEYKSSYGDVTDIRNVCKPVLEKEPVSPGEGFYHQMFSERNGFYRNLSILDILLTEGPATVMLIKQNAAQIEGWV